MKQFLYNVFIFLSLYSLGEKIPSNYNQKDKDTIQELQTELEIDVVLEQPEFFLSDNPELHLKEALEYYNIEHPNIVYAQAVLETGHFKSRRAVEENNLFGLYNSRKKEYFKFNHWSESVEAYVKYIQRKYKGGDYYDFLTKIGYAEDPKYIKKVKTIVKQIENDTTRNSRQSYPTYI